MRAEALKTCVSELRELWRRVLRLKYDRELWRSTVDAMKRWVRGGGVVFAQKSAARWAWQTLMGRKPDQVPYISSSAELMVGPY